MMKRKSLKLFLVLGVVLLRLLASGCTPNPETKPSETEPEPGTIVFHELVKAENVKNISFSSTFWSYMVYAQKEAEIISFLDLFPEETKFVKDAEKANFDGEAVFGTMHSISVSFRLQDGEHIGMFVSPEGYACLYLNEQIFYLVSPEKLDYNAIVYGKWMEENA